MAERAHGLVYHRYDEIVREGEAGFLFFMIINGSAEVSQNGRHIRYLTSGEFFGEQALIYN